MKLAILFSFFCFLAVNEAHVMKCGTPLTNRCATGVATVSCGILPWCRGHGMRVKKVSPTQCCCYKKGKTEVVIIKGGKVVVQAGDGGDGGDGGRGGYAAGIGGKAGSGGFGGDGGEGGIVNITYVGGYAAIREKVEHLEDHDDPNNTPAEYDYEEIPDDERDMVVIIESAEVFFEGGEGGEGGDGGAAGIARRGTNGTEGVDGDDGTDGAIVGGSAFKNGGTVIINGRVAQEYLKTLPFDSRGHYTNTGTIYINAFDGGDGGAGGVGGNSTATLGKAGSGGVGGEGGDGGDLVIQQ